MSTNHGARLPALSLVLAMGLIVAGTPQLARAASAPQEANDEVLELSLAETVRLAFEKNLDIGVIRFDRSMAEESVVVAKGTFDPAFYLGVPAAQTLISPPTAGGFGGLAGTGGFGFASTEEPSASALSGAEVSTSDTFGTLFDFGQTLQIGTRYDIAYSVGRSTTNSIFTSVDPVWSNRLSVSVAHPLLRGSGRDAAAAGLLLARRNAEISRAAFRGQVEAILVRVEQAYWEMVFSERNLEVKQQSLDLALEQLERTQAQVEVGLIAPVQETQAEVAVANREAELINARSLVGGAHDQLRGLLHAETLPGGWDTLIEATDQPAAEAIDVDLEQAIAQALANRAELESANLGIAARNVEVNATRNALLPRLDLVGAISFTGLGGDTIIRDSFPFGEVVEVVPGDYNDAIDQLFTLNFPNWQLGVNVSYVLGNHAAKGNYARATLAEDRARVELESARQQVILEVRNAVRQLGTAAETVNAMRKARELAERQLEIEQDRFEVGMSTNFEVLQFQEDLAEARSAELRAELDHQIARSQLERSTGTLLERFAIEIR